MDLKQALAKLKELGATEVFTFVESLAKTTETLTTEKKTLETRVAEQDTVIKQKTDDIVKMRKAHDSEIGKLKELSEEEKKQMSQKEIELHNATLKLQEDQEKFQSEQAEARARDVAERRGKAFDKIVGTKDPELRKKAEENYAKILDNDKAYTEAEIEALATQAFNMLGVPRPEGVGPIVNGGGDGAPGSEGGTGFADKPEGKSLAEGLGLTQAAPPKA